MSFHPIKKEDKFYTDAKIHTTAERESTSSQVKLNQLAQENQDLPITFIKDTLIAQNLKEDAESFEFKVE